MTFQGRDQVLLRRASDSKNYAVNISFLSPDDQTYLGKLRETTLKAQLDAEAATLAKQGKVEVTVQLLENYPEKAGEFKECWMDAEFVKIDGANLLYLTRMQEIDNRALSNLAGYEIKTTDWREDFLGFSVRDNNGKSYGYCFASKHLSVGKTVASLKSGDSVRITGHLLTMDAFGGDKHQRWLCVQSVRVVAPAVKEEGPR